MQNTQNRTLWALVVIIGLFAVIGLGYKYGFSGQSAVAPATNSGSAQPSKTPVGIAQQILTFNNTDYGYSISFPGTMGVARGATGLTIQPLFPADTTSITDAFIEIAATVAKCPTRPGQNVVTLDTIKGVPFTITKGTSGTTNFVEYHADKNSICYSATLTVNTKPTSDSKMAEANKRALVGLQAQFTDIVKSFAIKDSVTPPKNSVINSIAPATGAIGSRVTLKGDNLGTAGDVWMIDANEQIGHVDAVNVTSDGSKVVVKIPTQICTTTDSPCPKYIPVNPGQYSIYTQPAGKTSNTVSFTVSK